MAAGQVFFSTFVINLDASTERLAHVGAELAKAGLAFERVPAVLGIDMPDSLRPYFFDASGELAAPLRLGEIGCYASHLAVCRRMVEDDIPVALVLEDDALLAEDFADFAASLLENLPAQWDVVRLSNPPKRAYVPLCDLAGDRQLIRYSKIPLLTTAHLLSLSGARKMLKPGLRAFAIDQYMCRPWLNGLDTYGVAPPPVSDAALPSNIDGVDLRTTNVKRDSLFNRSNFGRKFAMNIRTLGVFHWGVCHALNGADRIMRLTGDGDRTLIHAGARWIRRRRTSAS